MIVVPLKVSGAFHSPFMKTAQAQFEAFLDNFRFSPPKIPVFSNRTAEIYQASGIPQNLAQQITHPVRWTEIITNLISKHGSEFEEIGPGKVLTGLLTHIKKGQ